MLDPESTEVTKSVGHTTTASECSDFSGDDASSDDLDDSQLNSHGAKKEIDDCFESPLQSLEAEFLANQRFYLTTYVDRSPGNLCCNEKTNAELMSKTIKAATLELSAAYIHTKRSILVRSQSLSTGNLPELVLLEASLTSSSSFENNLQGVQSGDVYHHVSSENGTLDNSLAVIRSECKINNLQMRRKQSRCRKDNSSESEDGSFSCCAKSMEKNVPVLQLPRFSCEALAATNNQTSPTSPTERHQFFKNLSHLFRYGCSSKKMQNMGPISTLPKHLTLMLWMELLAWHKACSIDEINHLLDLKRQTIPIVIDEVLSFTVKYSTLSDASSETKESGFESEDNATESSEFNSINTVKDMKDLSLESPEHVVDSSLTNFINDDVQLPSLKSDDVICECSDTLSHICQYCIDTENVALHQVESLLSKLDNIEHLYPSLNTLTGDYNMYRSKRFTCRTKTLYLWRNITYDLRQKIDALAKLFGVKNKAKVGWPCYSSSEGSAFLEAPSISCCPDPRPPSLLKVQFKNNPSFSNSPSSSISDRSEKSKNSYPSSPDIQITNPFEAHLEQTSSDSSSEMHSKYSRSISQSPNELHPKYSNSVYHKYVDYTLRHKGLKRMYRQLFGFLRPILYRIHATLKKPKPPANISSTAKVVTNQSADHKKTDNTLPVKKEYLDELAMYGVWSRCFQLMALPTFHKPFFFILRVLLDVVHECLVLRLEQQPTKPSSFSVGQLIKECKEVLKAATQTRQKYINLAQTVLGESGKEIIEAQLDAFDSDAKKMLLVYLEYLHHRILVMQNIAHTMLHQKNYLEEEWAFVRVICPHIPCGEAAAAKKFCFMSNYLLNSIGIFLTDGVQEQIKAYENIINSDSYDSVTYRKTCREKLGHIKQIFQESSERARQVVTLAKSLRKDLEIAAEFSILVPASELLAKLQGTGHIRVTAPHISNHVMFVPGNLQHCEMFIWQLVDMTCGHEALDPGTDQAVYLIMMQCCKNDLKGLYWDGPTIVLEPTAEANITLSHVEVDGLLLVVNHSSQLLEQCKIFRKAMGNTLQICKQQTSCNYAIAEALTDLKTEALKLWDSLTQVVKQSEESLEVLCLSSADESDHVSLVPSFRDVLHQGYKFAFEYQKYVTRLITGEAREKFYCSLASFAEQWMNFITEKCEKGRGLRPMWAKQGVDFLLAVYDSQYGQSISDLEFEAAKQNINSCLRHLLGCSEKSPVVSQVIRSPRASNIRFPFSSRGCISRSSLPQSSSENYLSSSPVLDETWRRKRSRDDTIYAMENRSHNDVEMKPAERVRKKIAEMEKEQHQKLLDKGIVGCISDLNVRHTPLHVSARRVTFPWQRCFKIGEGRFGKVYTAVNNTTGELIAMKEIRLQPNDHRAIKEALDEIRTFEGIKHKNLVRYYGVEVHREEMLIFMEYCNEGSLENAAQLQLPEPLIRKYTRQLLEAVNVLHEHGIVHRDIKSANIFLTSDGNLKLGDFGCSIKLKSNTTMPGELCGFVGTPAYMAPEVFTKSREIGHGRAADVWSFGCVVLEMLTGKRPWHDLDNSYQIMFTVGMGNVPEIPGSLSEEAQDILEKCLIFDPDDRWTTSELLIHPFTKIPEEEYG